LSSVSYSPPTGPESGHGVALGGETAAAALT
jgi:hypothetical protein